jgi:hypothetical protein
MKVCAAKAGCDQEAAIGVTIASPLEMLLGEGHEAWTCADHVNGLINDLRLYLEQGAIVVEVAEHKTLPIPAEWTEYRLGLGVSSADSEIPDLSEIHNLGDLFGFEV